MCLQIYFLNILERFISYGNSYAYIYVGKSFMSTNMSVSENPDNSAKRPGQKTVRQHHIPFHFQCVVCVCCWYFQCDRCSLILLETNVGNLIRVKFSFLHLKRQDFCSIYTCTLTYIVRVQLFVICLSCNIHCSKIEN